MNRSFASAATLGPAVVVAGLVFGLYALTMPTVLPATGDARAQTAETLEYAIELKPHHLLVTPADRLAVAVAQRLGFRAPAFVPIQVLNALAGATACGLFLLWLGRLGVSLPVAVPYALALACSYGHWLHSREAEAGILANLFLLVALNLRPLTAPRSTPVLFPAVFAALSILCALNTAALMPGLALLDAVEAERRARWRGMLGFLIATAAMTGAAFLVLPWVAWGTGPRALIEKVTTHPSMVHMTEQGEVTLANALRAVSGLVNAFTGDSAVATALKERLRGDAPVPVSSGDWVRFGLGALIVAVLALRLLDRPRDARERVLWLATWAALVPTALFNFFWLGSDPQFWLPVLPFLGAWSAVRSMRAVRLRRTGKSPLVPEALVPAAAAFALAIANFPTSVPTLLSRNGGLEWQQSRSFAEQAGPLDLLFYAGSWGTYLPRSGTTSTVNLVYALPPGKEKYRQALLDTIDGALDRGGRVFALGIFGEPTATGTGAWDEIRAISGRGQEDWVRELRTRYDLSPAEPPIFGDLWQIRARTSGTTHPEGRQGSTKIRRGRSRAAA